MQILLQHGASVDIADSSGRTPLLWAAARDSRMASWLLLCHNASINATDNTGRSPLMYASAQGDDYLVRLYLDYSADINQRDNIRGWTSLFWAAENGHGTTVKLLLEHGADRNVVDAQSRTLGDVARESGKWRQLKFALQTCREKGSEENSSEEDGND